MAPAKSRKRAPVAAIAALQDASPQKKVRVDPMFEGILATLRGAEDLNDHCKEMLISMAIPSLSKPKFDRHDVQQLGVSMIEETILAQKTKLVEAVEEARKELSDLENSKTTIMQRADNAKASLEDKVTTKAAAQAAHDQAQGLTKSAEEALAEANRLREKAEDTLAALQKQKTAIETAYQEHFKEPMEASHGPHLNFLMPFIEILGFEESLISALPSCCVKTKEQRGGFDDLVLTELGKAIVTKIEALGKNVSDETLVISERKAGVVCAQETFESRNLIENTAATDLDAATTAQSEAEVEVSQASEEWTAFEPRMLEATDKYNLHDVKCIEFQEGTLKSFETLKDKDTPMLVELEAATAGA